MRRSALLQAVCTLLLSLSLCFSEVLSAQGQVQNQARCFFARISSSAYQTEMATLNRRIDELKKKLRAMSWAEFDQAEYKLRDTALLDGGGGILELNAIFMSPKSREPVSRTGRSEPSDKLEYRVETALADLLKRTLFDPDLGP